MKYKIYKNNSVPFLVEKNGIIYDVNDLFIKFTEFEKTELNNKNMFTVWHNVLHINAEFNFVNSDLEVILFTKSLEARFVTVSKIKDTRTDETIYIFIENPDSRLENKLLFIEKMISDEKFGIGIYSAEDLTLLKANETYLSYLPNPFNTKESSYGKQLKEIFPLFKTSYHKGLWKKIVESNESLYISEMQGFMPGFNDKYWDNTITPIVENGKVKYVVSMLQDVTERISNRNQIKIKNQQLEAIFNSTEDIIFILDKYAGYISGNKISKEFVNLLKENLSPPKKFFKAFDSNGTELSSNEFNFEAVLTGEEIEKVMLTIELNGEMRYFKLNGKPIFNKDNEVVSGIFVLHDITEEINRIKIIEQQNRELEAIIDNSYNYISVVDKNGNYIRKNKALKKVLKNTMIYKLPTKNVADTLKHHQKYYNERYEEITLEKFPTCRVLKGEKFKDQRVIIETGQGKKYLNFDGIPVYDENGDLEMGVLIAHDITELMQSYKQIEAQKKELDTIIENMSDGLVVIDKEGKIIKKNKAIKEVGEKARNGNHKFNYASETICKERKYYDEFDNELSEEDLPLSKILKGNAVHNQRIKSKKGTHKTYAEFNCTPIFDNNGDLQYGIMLRHDMTDIMKKENKIREQQRLLYISEKNRREMLEKTLIMKDEFISMITHEFKTPLNVIYSAVQLIESFYINQLPDRVKDLICNMKQNTFRQLRLVNNLLDITRLNSGRLSLNMQNIDIIFLTKMIVESVKLYANQKNIELSFETNINSRTFAVDDEKYERILLNLLSNAIKFTPNGGKITVTVKENKLNNTICISITDSGIGIPKEKQELIFERFGQVESTLSRQAEGTGIGLSLVKLLVDVLEGSIKVDSELGAGSTFEVILPMKECEENKENNMLLDTDTRLVTSINVEFSDIYL